MAGQLTIDTLKASSGVLATQNGMTGIAKAWCNYSGSTSTINGSFNISSVTRSSAGNYVFNFSTAMANAGYSATVGFANSGTNTNTASNILSFTTSGFTLQHIENGATVDTTTLCIAVQGT